MPPTEYTPSVDIGKGYVFYIKNVNFEGTYADGEADIVCIAENSNEKFSFGWSKYSIGFFMAFVEGDINDNMIPPGADQMPDETISTIDGNILCEVWKYIQNYDGSESTIYIGKNNGVPYYSKVVYADGVVGETTLKGRIS